MANSKKYNLGQISLYNWQLVQNVVGIKLKIMYSNVNAWSFFLVSFSKYIFRSEERGWSLGQQTLDK